ncbi:glutathione S-transferase family protein [Sphingorhabdus sp. 109]|jgi:GST-like protein|uniref:glutathione S-transferase family protein n=1 Tax=Sphingorhabdus sp. 109 TaxID=2653173 RepID=UPI0012F356A2|nr:glutathione S-transferase N-terminal domain-containing protein [Sphingorhabdus sp. 109]VWX60360.1 Disulfide-bond oxidoreductase YfcG [Sphingorhabdus sp. 109]
MIDFYYWPTPNGHKISIALEEMELEYAVKPINILTGEQHTPEFIAISPNNRVPAIVDHDGPDGNPHAVFESGAILLYLAQKYDKFWPADPVEQSLVTQWLFFQCANVGPMFGQCGYFNGYAAERIEHGINRYCGETKRLYGLIDRRLGEHEYLAGEKYSLADMATFPWMIEKQQKFHGIDVTEFPNVQRWLAAINSRPGAQRGLQVMAKDLKIGNPTEEAREAFFGRN